MVRPPEIWWCKGQVSSKYGGAGDRSIFGYENMVVQGTDQLKIWWCRGQITAEIWWCRGQISSKYGGAGDRSAQRSKIWWCRGQITAEIWWCRGQVQIARSIIPTVYSIFCGLVFSLLII